MHDQIDNPLIPARFEILIFWGITTAIFIGWSIFCGFVGYMAAGA